MAERYLKKEVQKLYLGEAQEFRGEGILAVTKALLQWGISYVAGVLVELNLTTGGAQ